MGPFLTGEPAPSFPLKLSTSLQGRGPRILPQPEAGGHHRPDAPQGRGTRLIVSPGPLPGAWTTLGPAAQGGRLSQAGFAAESAEVGGEHRMPPEAGAPQTTPFSSVMSSGSAGPFSSCRGKFNPSSLWMPPMALPPVMARLLEIAVHTRRLCFSRALPQHLGLLGVLPQLTRLPRPQPHLLLGF